MRTAPRFSLIVVGTVAILVALFGLYYNAMTVFTAFRGGFSHLIEERKLTYFYQAFYVMSATCIACYLLLLLTGIDFLRLRFRWVWPFTGVLIFEVIYFFCIGISWLAPNAGMSIATATGVANGGLMAQFIILFPLWAPLVLFWARQKARHENVAA